MTLHPRAKTRWLPLALPLHKQLRQVLSSQLLFPLSPKFSTSRNIGTTCLYHIGRTGNDHLRRPFTTSTMCANMILRNHCEARIHRLTAHLHQHTFIPQYRTSRVIRHNKLSLHPLDFIHLPIFCNRRLSSRYSIPSLLRVK